MQTSQQVNVRFGPSTSLERGYEHKAGEAERGPGSALSRAVLRAVVLIEFCWPAHSWALLMSPRGATMCGWLQC